MPDWERRIEQWRATLTGPAAAPEVAEELEGHLREELERLTRQGLAEEAAWQQAVNALGRPEVLAGEFAKVAPAELWLPVWLAFGAGALLVVLALFVGIRLQVRREDLLLAVHVVSVTLGYSATFLAGFLAVCYVGTLPLGDLRPGQSRFLGRALLLLNGLALALTGVGVVLGALWAREHLGRFWAWDPRETAGGLVVAWDLALTVFWWRYRGGDRVGVLLGLAGNVVVSLAWFGAPLIEGGLHA